MEQKYKRWEKSESTDGMTKRVCVEQVENGFIITMEKYGSQGDSDSKTSATQQILVLVNVRNTFLRRILWKECLLRLKKNLMRIKFLMGLKV